LLFALAAGLIIFTLLFDYQQQPQQGFGLLFQMLPWLIGKGDFGQFWGAAFFIMLAFAAWTSAIALSEPFIVWVIEKTHCSRRFAGFLLGVVAWCLGCVVVLSLNEWKGLTIAGLTLFGFMDFLTSRFLIPVGGLLLALFVGVRMKRALSKEAVNFKYDWMHTIWYLNIRWVVPVAIMLVFVFGILKLTESDCYSASKKDSFVCAVVLEHKSASIQR
jgi:NSS family neurotransmitter:Na+ symporter